jgi:hypothetical protein
MLAGKTIVDAQNQPEPDHECGPYCFQSAETVAREIINETDQWKRGTHNWRNRVMVVTRCGCAGCEIALRADEWQYKQRPLTTEEQRSFKAEYGQVSFLLLSLDLSPSTRIRGFILNGRKNGWNLSVEKR